MEWSAVQHLDLGHVGRGQKPLQPHAAAFDPNQALIAAAIRNYIIEFNALTGSKLPSIDIGAPVVRMSYSPRAVMLWFLFLGKWDGYRKFKDLLRLVQWMRDSKTVTSSCFIASSVKTSHKLH